MLEIDNLSKLLKLVEDVTVEIEDFAFQHVDFTQHEVNLMARPIRNCLFMGCNMSEGFFDKVHKSFNNIVLPSFNVPFETFPPELYTRETIYKGFDHRNPETYNNTYDKIVYDHYVKEGRANSSSIYETLARRLHDHSITDAIEEALCDVEVKSIVAIMGGHDMSRKSPDYTNIALLAKKLAEENFFLLTGGGPGAMEATHLGVFFSGRDYADLQHAVELLSEAPIYNDRFWLSKAYEVIEKYPKIDNLIKDIGIPTWLYGHEPPTPFASLIAKYFANSVREDGLLALAKGGVVYTPGSAGTIQEVFQDATQNHYVTCDIASPMIFLNKHFWIKEKPIYPTLKDLAKGYKYAEYLYIFDDTDEIIDALRRFRYGKE